MAKIALLVLVVLAACSALPANDCAWAKPVRPAVGDDISAAPGLARSALEHNRAGASICGWVP